MNEATETSQSADVNAVDQIHEAAEAATTIPGTSLTGTLPSSTVETVVSGTISVVQDITTGSDSKQDMNKGGTN